MHENHDAIRRERIKASLTLLATATIWGSAFSAQRVGNELVGPFTFNAIRFALGALVLLPIIGPRQLCGLTRDELRGGALLGILLFLGASFQQIGLLTTTAGQSGFITGLYLVLVPLFLWIIWGQRVGRRQWAGAGVATVGLFFLSIRASQSALAFSSGDAWTLAGAFAWTFQVIGVSNIAPGKNPLRLAVLEFLACALLCAAPAAALERETWSNVVTAGPAILYTGAFSTSLAYTAQISAQRRAPPAAAALIMSLESVFAALFGWLLLNEQLTQQQLLGCGLMLAGMLLSQIRTPRRKHRS